MMRFWKVLVALIVGTTVGAGMYGASLPEPLRVKPAYAQDDRIIPCPDVLSGLSLQGLLFTGTTFNRRVIISNVPGLNYIVELPFTTGYAMGPNVLELFENREEIKRYTRWYDLTPNPLESKTWVDLNARLTYQAVLYSPRIKYSCTGWRDILGQQHITLNQMEWKGNFKIESTSLDECDDPNEGCGGTEGGSNGPVENITGTPGAPFDTWEPQGALKCRVRWTYDLATGNILNWEILYCYDENNPGA